MMARRILVAIDGSETTGRVLEAVKKLMSAPAENGNGVHHGQLHGYRQDGYEVTLLHVVPPYLDSVRVHVPRILEDLMDVEAMLRTVTVRQGETVVEQAASLLEEAGIYPQVKVAIGSPSECICEEAERGHYDLVILGRRDTSALRRLFGHGVAEYVQRHCPAPVMVVA